MDKRIVFTGGGSAGHVMANLVLMPKLIKQGWHVQYIGSKNGIEKQLVAGLEGVDYYSVSTGKLRRYFDWDNAKDLFKVMGGVGQSYRLIRKLKPHVVFSGGGFVEVPVVIGAALNRVPIILRETDVSLGLANKLSLPFAKKICTTFPETEKAIRSKKSIYIGSIVRESLKNGDAERGLAFCQFTKEKPVLLIMGGSQGAERINEAVRMCLNRLLKDFFIVHICGKGKVDASIQLKGYLQFEYVHDELADLMAMADVVVSRAGSNSIFECLALRKPMLLIPLSNGASRGDQILNAKSFMNSGYAEILFQENLNRDTLMDAVYHLYKYREKYVKNMESYEDDKGVQMAMDLIVEMAK
ncbi:UDP-N-acetylglucosamine--N-acetylmuramyl-(pentapeptide) pyrophosphoryl-undecaprenol N-acetylglucosamine transferase [Scopulibacillus daqui]|uniref:UDP-N-acetylglucosamine--N-acetylmuramyl-(pentapeptide) pyrophosphoryl-undecaprenol N-acetylglucosamine transferase n=1 Tax=Scopulibacillus daqui TaxID=1469162 RepID=A0ABS2Q3X8_9BACL|nr:undecaprenyldiphospho-muramoylpentapeptide beta-N-acetylglucosaminyltransferase [Scopulibacillus daqui]MBM7646943.1 UDP-N-acetylglucosamine--N-acetylmuramyl-(pentapeptide) pyrophosphoryl-undecaprenol N-acetylglucosamine transferase [Scopulibacillus daqui]